MTATSPGRGHRLLEQDSGLDIDFLLCAVAERYRFPILTTDEDFLKFGRVLPLRLHALDK